MAPPKSSNRKAKGKSADSSRNPATARYRKKKWTFLFYLCGDNDVLEKEISAAFKELWEIGASRDIHVVVQCDFRKGARCYFLPEGPLTCEPPHEADSADARINTGDPKEAVRFLTWGIEQAPSDHVAVIISGLGIHPANVRKVLLPSGGLSDPAELEAFTQRHLFSICHDQTSQDALEAAELRTVFSEVAKARAGSSGESQDTLPRPVDLIGLELDAAAFVEIAYQLRDLGDVLVASQRPLPDDGWPHGNILSRWQERLAGSHPPDSGGAMQDGSHPGGNGLDCAERSDGCAAALGRLIVKEAAKTYPEAETDLRITAISLPALNKTGRMLDTVALALMQNLGDWQVLHATRQAVMATDYISPHLPANRRTPAWARSDDHLPAVDMVELLERLSEALGAISATNDQKRPNEYMRKLVDNALNLLRSSETPLFLDAWPKPEHGLSILIPPVPTQADRADGGRQGYSLDNSNYLKLEFCQDVHWPAVLGAFQIINEKPHTLWGLISAVLAEASGPARDGMLQRLISRGSGGQGFKQQFKSLSADVALTLSMEPKESDCTDRRTYCLRLESSLAGATVAEHQSNVSQFVIDGSLLELERLLNSREAIDEIKGKLEGVGRALGEDIIQGLATRLGDERENLAGQTGSTPHLRLQIPRQLMRFPWELMHDSHGMLCERFALGRQVFMDSQASRRPARRGPRPIRVLVIGNPEIGDEFARRHKFRPPSLGAAENEADTVATRFQELNDGELGGLIEIEVCALIGKRITVDDARDLLREGYDIIHYAGHGHFDKAEPEGSAWMMSDGFLRAQEIRNTLAWTQSPPWLVYANACEAGMDGGEPTSRYQGDVFGLATAFINQGVSAYIAPLWKVQDLVAAELATRFYDALLLDRLSLGEALRRGKVVLKKDLLAKGGEDELPLAASDALSWASTVLYGDPTSRLLKSLWRPADY